MTNRPIIVRDDTPGLKCPMCGAGGVKAVGQELTDVRIRCGTCGYVWAIPDRRNKPRP